MNSIWIAMRSCHWGITLSTPEEKVIYCWKLFMHCTFKFSMEHITLLWKNLIHFSFPITLWEGKNHKYQSHKVVKNILLSRGEH